MTRTPLGDGSQRAAGYESGVKPPHSTNAAYSDETAIRTHSPPASVDMSGVTMNHRKLIALLILIPFVEFGATVLLTTLLGPGRTYGLFAVTTVAGLAYHWITYRRLKRRQAAVPDLLHKYRHVARAHRYERVMSHPQYEEWSALWAEWLFFWIGTLFLIIPGVVTDLVAFVLLFPAVRQRLCCGEEVGCGAG